MSKLRYLACRDNVYRFRIRLSSDLRAIIGKREISRSLHTSDHAVARDRLAVVWAEWTKIVQFIRNEPGLTREQITGLVEDFVETQFDKFGALKRAAAITPSLQPTLDKELDYHRQARWQLASSVAEDNYIRVQAYLDEYLYARGVKFDRLSASYEETIRRLALAWIEILNAFEQGIGFRERFTPSLEPRRTEQLSLPAHKPEASRAKGSKAIGDLVDPYVNVRERAGIGQSYITEIRTALSWFSQWFGLSTKLSTLKPEDMRDYRDGLLTLPSNWAKKLKGMSIREAAAFNADGHLGRLEVQDLESRRLFNIDRTDLSGPYRAPRAAPQIGLELKHRTMTAPRLGSR